MIKVGLLGLGTIGSGVYKIISENKESIEQKIGTELMIEKILVNDLDKKREINIKNELLTDNAEHILENPEINLIVELIGGEKPAHQYVMKAINNKKSVITANKLIIAKYGSEILRAANDNNVQVSFEGSVAGGIPIIRPLKESLVASNIKSIFGILNGTTNYILTKMTEENKEFKEVLKEAQELGYAESDPYSDISGLDAAYKISILSSITFETYVDINSVSTEGIEDITLTDIKLADELDYVIKLLAIGKKQENGIDIRVHPAFISKSHPLALVNGVYNAIYLHGDIVGDIMSYGKGAGQMPTGSAVVADIIQTAKDINYNRPNIYSNESNLDHNIINIDEIKNLFYLRVLVNDKPGVMSEVTGILGKNQVSLASVLQKHRLTPVVPLVLVTHPVKEKNLNNSLEELRALKNVKSIESVIRVVEDF
ncbi:MAG TPA: homoserine dehydrogenase [Halanaerobiales bacterium]|nr:homoserine dehydrogenase [Halanaerobiales bacterium]